LDVTLDMVLIEYVFIEIVTELKINHVYKTVLLTIQVPVYNSSETTKFSIA
jgi:hypothetical protein